MAKEAAVKKTEPEVAAAPAPAPAAPERKPPPPIPQNCFDLKEQKNPGYWVCVDPVYTLEDLLEPGTWANIAGSGKLRSYSTVEVHWADRSKFAEFYVHEAGRSWAIVELLRHYELGKVKRRPRGAEFKVSYNGPVDQWRIVNVDNNTVLRAGLATETAAHAFLAEHKKKIA